MDISFHTIRSNLDTTRGYGHAGYNIVTSLQKLGHRVPFNHTNAPIQISFTQPDSYEHYDHQYKIGYTPWESTELPPGWLENMNRMDEVWATSPWVAKVYRDAGVKVPVYVYEHGVERMWKPKERKRGEVLKFLHIGEPAPRKGGQLAFDAFRKAFGDRKDVHLTIKGHHQHFIRQWTGGGVGLPDAPNVSVMANSLNDKQMVKLMHDHHVLVYPSYGEGFGFIPLQALATGMPVISTSAWAPYSYFLNDLKLSARRIRSQWVFHPGQVYEPDFNHLVDLYRECDSDYFYLKQQFYKQSFDVHTQYNWDRKTRLAWTRIEEMFA